MSPQHSVHSVYNSDQHGREYTVPTADHAAINPLGSRVIVFADDDSQAEVAALHVATVVMNGS